MGWFRHAQSYLLEYFGDSPHRICFLVAREKGEVVGFCQQRNERYGPFGVRPDCRNRGIGRMLLFKCLETMAAKHVFYAYFLMDGRERRAALRPRRLQAPPRIRRDAQDALIKEKESQQWLDI